MVEACPIRGFRHEFSSRRTFSSFSWRRSVGASQGAHCFPSCSPSLCPQELLLQGCVFQERHGWERPGWFNPLGQAPVSLGRVSSTAGQGTGFPFRVIQGLQKPPFKSPPEWPKDGEGGSVLAKRWGGSRSSDAATRHGLVCSGPSGSPSQAAVLFCTGLCCIVLDKPAQQLAALLPKHLGCHINLSVPEEERAVSAPIEMTFFHHSQ